MNPISRRTFLKYPLVISAGLLASRLLSAQQHNTPKKNQQNQKPHPLQTCGGYTDRNGDGVCERSEQADKPCNAVKCPAHKKNVMWGTAKKNGAPKGTCSSWADPQKKGVCGNSSRTENPCIYAVCPANKKNSANSKKKA